MILLPCSLLCVYRGLQNSASAFDGFGDDESGFYQTYSRAFQQVWEAEQDWSDLDSSPDATGEKASGGRSGGGRITWGKGEAPRMGRGNDAYEVAEAFYSSWSAFASGLSFGWVDEYNVNEVSNATRAENAHSVHQVPRNIGTVGVPLQCGGSPAWHGYTVREPRNLLVSMVQLLDAFLCPVR